MTQEQQTAYWKHYARQHEARAKAFGELTPEQVQQMQARNEELETAQLSASDKALKDAAKQAAAEATAAAEAAWKPKYQMAELKAAASEVIKGDQLKAFLAITDPAKFAGEDGEIDTEQVMGHLTALYGQQPPSGTNGDQQQRNWGQHGGPPPATPPGESGRAEAERRKKARQGANT